MSHHNALYQKAWEILKDQMILEESVDKEPIRPEPDLKKLEEGIRLLEEVISINPENWSAYWAMGKAYQTMGDKQKQYDAFKKAQQIARKHPDESYSDAIRELVLSCLELEKIKEAIYYGKQAIEFSPDDFTLWSNFSICLLLDGQLDNAENYANKALGACADDGVAKNVLAVVKKIRNGELEVKSFNEMAKLPDFDKESTDEARKADSSV